MCLISYWLRSFFSISLVFDTGSWYRRLESQVLLCLLFFRSSCSSAVSFAPTSCFFIIMTISVEKSKKSPSSCFVNFNLSFGKWLFLFFLFFSVHCPCLFCYIHPALKCLVIVRGYKITIINPEKLVKSSCRERREVHFISVSATLDSIAETETFLSFQVFSPSLSLFFVRQWFNSHSHSRFTHSWSGRSGLFSITL